MLTDHSFDLDIPIALLLRLNTHHTRYSRWQSRACNIKMVPS